MSADALWGLLEQATDPDLEPQLWAAMVAAPAPAHDPSAQATTHMDQGMRGRMLAGIFDLLLMEDEPRRALLDFEVPNHRSYGATLAGYRALFEGLAAVLAAQDPGNEAGREALQARCARILEDIEARNP
ncbi:MAG: hypothetical protein ACO4AD_11310 [Pseudomonadales bacterium]